MKRFGVLLVILALGGGAFLWYRAQTAPRVSVTPFAQLPKAEQQKRRTQAQTLVKQVETIARDAKAGVKKPFALRITQDELNTLVQDRLKTKNLPIRNLRVGLQNGQLVLEGDADYNGFAAPVSLVGSVSAQNGDVLFSVDSLNLGPLPAPNEWKTKVQKAVSDGLTRALKDKGSAKIEAVEIGDGVMTLKGRTG